MYYVLERKDVLMICPYMFQTKEELLYFVRNNLGQSMNTVNRLKSWLNKTYTNDCKNFASFQVFSKVD